MGSSHRPVVTESYWKTRQYETLGLVDIVTPTLDVIAEDIEEQIAKHIVLVHNEWWDEYVWLSYYDNLRYSHYYSVVDFPLTEDDWFDYSEAYESSREQD